ncbi:MAG: hypothetical protein ABSG53_22620, partial [Thermoguttaceae bacterium]
MSDRDWIQHTIQHRETDTVPYNFMFSPPARLVAEEHYGEDLDESLSLPLRMSGPKSPKPLYANPVYYGDTITDEFGVVWTTSRIDRGSPVGPCLQEPDLSKYVFPNPAEESRFTDLASWFARQEGHYRIIWVGDLWERATFMRGMESILL